MLKPTLGMLFPAIFAVYMPTCYGPWGKECAPDAHATYTFVRNKQHGVNPA